MFLGFWNAQHFFFWGGGRFWGVWGAPRPQPGVARGRKTIHFFLWPWPVTGLNSGMVQLGIQKLSSGNLGGRRIKSAGDNEVKLIMKLATSHADGWVRTSNPVIRSPARYRWTTISQHTTAGLPVHYRWTTSTLPLDYQHTTAGLPVHYRWTTSTLPLDYQYTTAGLPSAWGQNFDPEKNVVTELQKGSKTSKDKKPTSY